MGTWLGERFRHLARIAIIRQASSEFGVPLHLGKELFDFIRNREAKKQAVAVAVQPEVWGEAQLRAPGKGAGDDRSGVMGCVVEAKAVAITETVVRFSAPPQRSSGGRRCRASPGRRRPRCGFRLRRSRTPRARWQGFFQRKAQAASRERLPLRIVVSRLEIGGYCNTCQKQ